MKFQNELNTSYLGFTTNQISFGGAGEGRELLQLDLLCKKISSQNLQLTNSF